MLGMKIKSLLAYTAVAMLLLSGCGGGNNDSAQLDSGDVLISFTDAEGDFATYTVDVLSVRLTRADGTEVETLPVKTRIDFAQYTEMTEFLTAARVPRGIYVKGSVVLDYSNADIQVEDASGSAIPVSQILDQNGDPISTLEVSINLEGHNQLPIAPGIPKNLMLDFDLERSHTVSLSDPVTINVNPVFVAEVDPQAPRIHRIRGPLKSVDLANSEFDVYIRPFYHRIANGGRVFGNLRVITNDQTFFEIDGTSYQGQDGLVVLDGKPQLTGVIARGELKFNPIRFVAAEVYAGSSVPGGDMDVVRGTVTGRTVDDKVIVRGATLFRTDGVIVFHDNVTIQLADSTTVTKQLNLGTFSIDDISVGQRIAVFGTVTNDLVSDLQMDAANGYARMRLSSVQGDVTSLPGVGTDLTMQLQHINGRSVSIYDFSGTGTSPADDADPTNYEVATGSLGLDGIAVNDLIAVRGFPTPFGTAPSDYTALTVIKP